MVTVRRFKPGDEWVLHDIFFQTIHHVNIMDYTQNQIDAWAPEVFDEDGWTERVRSINPYVAMLNEKIVGYADIQKDGYIDHFFCHWRYQGTGIGGTLMRTLIEDGRKRSVSRCYANVSISAKPFFEYFGFEVVRGQEVKVRDQKLKNFLMEKSLVNN